MLAVGILELDPDIAEPEPRDALSSNLGRCTGYQNIQKAVLVAAARNAQIGLIGRSVKRLAGRGKSRSPSDLAHIRQRTFSDTLGKAIKIRVEVRMRNRIAVKFSSLSFPAPC